MRPPPLFFAFSLGRTSMNRLKPKQVLNQCSNIHCCFMRSCVPCGCTVRNAPNFARAPNHTRALPLQRALGVLRWWFRICFQFSFQSSEFIYLQGVCRHWFPAGGFQSGAPSNASIWVSKLVPTVRCLQSDVSN